MPFMAWAPSLELGLPTFDKQHRQLVGLLNELHDAMLARRGKDVIGKTLGSLILYTETHFSQEEAFLEQCGYPGLAGHKVEHARLNAQVSEAQKRYISGDSATLTMELLEFLRRWLVEHIQGSDRRYGDFVASRPAAR